MTMPLDENPDSAAAGRAVVILGADALVAAEPATPVQLAHACLRAGFRSVVPASWGDELIASAVLRELGAHKDAPAIQCSCPMVMQRLLSSGADLRPFLVALVPPPIAAARYLRALSAERLRITYVGRCPGSADNDIDARITPEELLSTLVDHGISVIDQPLVFDSVLPNDRRRYRSQAGGVPAPQALWNEAGERTLTEISGHDLATELAQALLSGHDVLIDCTPAVGCYCRGTDPHGFGVDRDTRHRIAALEPPRASSPILYEDVQVELRVDVSQTATTSPHLTTPESVASFAEAQPSAPTPVHDLEAGVVAPGGLDAILAMRRRSPSQGTRAVVLTPPTSKEAEGRQLPRAYVARRRPSPRGMRVIGRVDPEPVSWQPPVARPERTVAPVEAPSAAPARTSESEAAPGSQTVTGAGLHPHVPIAVVFALAAVVGTILGVIIGRLMA